MASSYSLLLLYLTRCYPLDDAGAAVVFVACVPPGLAGRLVGALAGLPDVCTSLGRVVAETCCRTFLVSVGAILPPDITL